MYVFFAFAGSQETTIADVHNWWKIERGEGAAWNISVAWGPPPLGGGYIYIYIYT